MSKGSEKKTRTPRGNDFDSQLQLAVQARYYAEAAHIRVLSRHFSTLNIVEPEGSLTEQALGATFVVIGHIKQVLAYQHSVLDGTNTDHQRSELLQMISSRRTWSAADEKRGRNRLVDDIEDYLDFVDETVRTSTFKYVQKKPARGVIDYVGVLAKLETERKRRCAAALREPVAELLKVYRNQEVRSAVLNSMVTLLCAHFDAYGLAMTMSRAELRTALKSAPELVESTSKRSFLERSGTLIRNVASKVGVADLPVVLTPPKPSLRRLLALSLGRNTAG